MREWESDPLFAAAEVVQDSADRMDSIFRHLLHEQGLVQGDHMDEKLISSIEYHKRDLATTLETAKWQLEDFEREVNASVMADTSQVKQNAVTRHIQFVRAIREQITHVQKSINNSAGNSLKNMNLNEQDRDGLALFLSGKAPVKHITDQESKDNNILRRFLDPAGSSSSKEDIDDMKVGETVSLNVNGISYLDRNLESTENFPTRINLGPSSSSQSNYGMYDEQGARDLEANEAKSESYLQKNSRRGIFGRMKLFGSLENFLSTYDNGASRSFTKRLKDGEEEQRQASLSSNVHPGMKRHLAQHLAQRRSTFGCSNFHLSSQQLYAYAMQSSSWITYYKEKCQRSLRRIQVRNHPVLSISLLLLTLLILSILVS